VFGDFGFTVKASILNFDRRGTDKFLAPEILLSDSEHPFNGPKVDIYALGILFFEFFFGEISYQHELTSSPSGNFNSKRVIKPCDLTSGTYEGVLRYF